MDAWQKAHRLMKHAFHEPPNARDKKLLTKILKKPLSEDLERRIVDFDAYCRLSTSMSLSTFNPLNGRIGHHLLPFCITDLESHGGIYVLHSHMNHSCEPTVSVRHFDQKTALSRITVRARRAIRPGEELTVTYVDPSMPLQARRNALMPWAFGTCTCTRCVREEKDAKGKGEDADSERDSGYQEKYDGLEEELRHGLGLL